MSELFDNRKPTSDRFKCMMISYNTMIKIMTGEVKVTNIPDWTRLVSCEHNFMRRCFICLIEHPSFDKVPPGQEPEFFCANLKECKLNPNEPRKLTFD